MIVSFSTTNTFTLKQGDLDPSVGYTILDSTGAPVDLTTALSVQLRIAPSDTHVETFTRSANVVSAPVGTVSYDWQVGDTDVVGVFYAEWVVTWPGPKPQTYPGDGYLIVQIEPKL